MLVINALVCILWKIGCSHFRFTAQEHQMGRQVNKNYLAESSIKSVGSSWKAVLCLTGTWSPIQNERTVVPEVYK